MKHHKTSASSETSENFPLISQQGHNFFSGAFHSYSVPFLSILIKLFLRGLNIITKSNLGMYMCDTKLKSVVRKELNKVY